MTQTVSIPSSNPNSESGTRHPAPWAPLARHAIRRLQADLAQKQRGLLSYQLPNGHESPETAAWWGRREGEVMPQPNIMAAHGLGPAGAASEVLPVLCALGLVGSGRWAAAAEPVLWREEPPEWDLDITADPRFRAALERAITEMPADIRHELDRLVTITEADVTEGLIRRAAHQDELRAEHGANRVICLPPTRDSVQQGLVFLRICELD